MMADYEAPADFHQLDIAGGFFDSFGPIYGRREGAICMIGFRVKPQHMNPLGICHGGMIASLADMQALGAQEIAEIYDRYTPTISLTVDYISPATLGAWVLMRIELLRATQTLLFSRGLITADDTLVARSSAIFKIGRPSRHTRQGIAPLF